MFRAMIGGCALALAGAAAAQDLPEYPVRTPVPANAVQTSAGARAPAGQTALQINMPGHRNFKPPFFPDAGWDSPLLENGDKFYDSYLIRYWRAPTLPPNHVDPAFRGREQRGWIAPKPYPARIARSRATAAEEALFERRMQFIVDEVMRARPLQNLHGASLSPVLTVSGYGQQYGAAGDGVMRGEIELKLSTIAPDVGATERMPDGTIRSEYLGPTLRIRLNPEFIDCAGPVKRGATTAGCSRSDGRVALTSAKPALVYTDGGDPRLSLPADAYAARGPSTEIRVLFVQHDRQSMAAREIERGRMHPHDPLGRVVAVLHGIDWEDLLRRANAVT